MATIIIRELIQRVQSLYSKGVQSDDSRLKPRHIYSKLLSARNTLLTQQLNKNQKISNFTYQVLPCVELIKADIHECPCLPPVGCCIWRTKHQLPRFLTGLDFNMIKSVTSLDSNTRYSEIQWEEKKFKAVEKYTSRKPDFFLRNNYLYITDRDTVQERVITIEALFYDVIEAARFPSYCPQETCKSNLDFDFHYGEKIDTLIEIAYDELVNRFNQNQEDASNNTRDNLDVK